MTIIHLLCMDTGVDHQSSKPHHSSLSGWLSHTLTDGRRREEENAREGGEGEEEGRSLQMLCLSSSVSRQLPENAKGRKNGGCMAVANSSFFNKLFARRKTPPLPHKLQISQTTPKNTPNFLAPSLPINSRKLGCYKVSL